jgi:alanine dehydrogenase
VIIKGRGVRNMIIGVLKEIKTEEYRVSAPPMAVESLVQAGHKVIVQTTAGEGSGFADDDYVKVGATIINNVGEVWGQAEMIYHVKEPIPAEYKYLRQGLILFTYLHLAAERELTQTLLENGVTGVAFETVENPDGTTPLLEPMSAVAGRVGTLVGAQYLGKMHGGSGKLIGGVPGTPPATVVVLGGGVVGTNSAQMALGLGARVIMLTRNLQRLKYLEEVMPGRFETRASNPYNIANAVREADIVIGAVLVPGSQAPIMVTREMVKTMRPGSVIVDIAIDQGGCIETSDPTTHANPIYVEDGVIHYCVTNMPGMYPRTSAIALSNATLPYALKLANRGIVGAVQSDECLAKGVNTYNKYCTNEPTATSLGLEYTPLSKLIK